MKKTELTEEQQEEERFNDFIASGVLDRPEHDFEEYETCIVEFDNIQRRR